MFSLFLLVKIFCSLFSIGINTLAFGHKDIDTVVRDARANDQGGDMVMDAAEANRRLYHGRFRRIRFEDGVDPRAAVADERVQRASIVLQHRAPPVKPNSVSPYVSAICHGVNKHLPPVAFDLHFSRDDTFALYDVASAWRDSGREAEEIKQKLHTMVEVLRNEVFMDLTAGDDVESDLE